jgi:excinuclease ABC subunit B
VVTDSMRRAMEETRRRRSLQSAYNETHNITPQTIRKPIDATLVAVSEGDYVTVPLEEEAASADVPPERLESYLAELEEKMREAARRFDFKQAAAYRDRLRELKSRAALV